jgi:hypothetical protein
MHLQNLTRFLDFVFPLFFLLLRVCPEKVFGDIEKYVGVGG